MHVLAIPMTKQNIAKIINMSNVKTKEKNWTAR